MDKLNILFENEDLLVINKPHNLTCTPSRAHFLDNLGTLAAEYLDDQNFVLRLLYRLDKDTAGIVLIAKNLEGFKKVEILEKEYFALCEGDFDKKEFSINLPIKTLTENGKNVMKRVVASDGKPAVTHVCVEKDFDGYSLIKLHLETGRTHQIRVHLSAIGHPLLGDCLYNEKAQDSCSFLLLKKVKFRLAEKEFCFEVEFPNNWQSLLKK